MITLCYSGRSKPSALKIAEASEGRIQAVRANGGDIGWGRANAGTRLNSDISNTTNKRVMRELFAENDVPTPRMVRNFSEAEFDYPIVGRPDQHTKGRGFWKCWNVRDYALALKGTRRKKAATHFMEYIDADAEYRCHIFNGKSIRISRKAFTDDTKKEYTTAKPDNKEEKKAVREASRQAVAALGLDFGTCDVLVKDGEAYVLEVNSAPGLGGSMPKLWADTFIRWAENE